MEEIQKHYHKEYKSWSTKINKGCGRKNTPLSKGHSFSWWERTVVLRTPSNSGIPADLGALNAVFGRTTFFSFWGLKFNGGSPVATERACLICFRLFEGRMVLMKKWFTFEYQANECRTNSGSSERGDTKGIYCHSSRNDLNFMDNYPWVYLSLSVFKAATLVIISV